MDPPMPCEPYCLGDTDIHQTHHAARVAHDVDQLEVSMDDPRSAS
jgi:hypothetical protein